MLNLWFFWVWSLKDFPSNKKSWPPAARILTQWAEKKLLLGEKWIECFLGKAFLLKTIPLLEPHKVQRRMPQGRWRLGAPWRQRHGHLGIMWTEFSSLWGLLYSTPRRSVMGWIASYPKRCAEVLTWMYLRMWPYLERGSLQMQFKMRALTRTQPHGHPELQDWKKMNERLLFNSPSPWHVVMAAQADYHIWYFKRPEICWFH